MNQSPLSPNSRHLYLTIALIEDGMSSTGGYSKAQLRALGLPWPPVKGWMQRLVGQIVHEKHYRQFLKLRNLHKDYKDACDHDRVEQLPGVGPHYAKEVCANCGKFMRWLAKPRV